MFEDYRDLAEHPRDEPGYREEATTGSILLPTLAVWAAITGDSEILGALANFASGAFQHSTLQLWYPGPDNCRAELPGEPPCASEGQMP